MRAQAASTLALSAALVVSYATARAGEADDYPAVTPAAAVSLPADAGAHPEFRTEWWYVTGWLETASREPRGFQLTFFRIRPAAGRDNPSAFAAHQLLIAHAAVSDPARGRLRYDERIARQGFGLAAAEQGRLAVHVRDWVLEERGGTLSAVVHAEGFSFELALEPAGPPLLNGRRGYSQKGPSPGSASLYYSLPQLRVQGRLVRDGRTEAVTGSAWLDHEWSSSYLDPQSVGWDWIGINLADGGALMAFRIRDVNGAARWAGGTLRAADGTTRALAPADVEFVPGRRWRSPYNAADYPVEWRVRAGPLEFSLAPLMDDQVSDSRLTTGALYWEGAVEARAAGRAIGRGYLELTGYGARLTLGDGSDSREKAPLY